MTWARLLLAAVAFNAFVASIGLETTTWISGLVLSQGIEKRFDRVTLARPGGNGPVQIEVS